MDIKVEDLNFTLQTYNCLKREQVNTLEDLKIFVLQKDLNTIRNLGKHQQDEIFNILRRSVSNDV